MTQDSQPRLDLPFAVFFVAFLGLPLVVLLQAALRGIEVQPLLEAEKRMRRPAPSWRWDLRAMREYPVAFDAWYRDAFGLRDTLVRTHNRALFSVFGISPGDMTVAGDDGWLFFTLYDELASFRGEDGLSAGEKAAWQAWMEVRSASLAERGTALCMALAPFKSSIYPEHVPARFGPAGSSRLDDLLAYLARESEVTIADLGAQIRAGRAQWPGALLYFPLGTHWTQVGALEGARAIVEALRPQVPGLPPFARSDWTLSEGDAEGDSWAGRLYLDGLLTQDTPLVRPAHGALQSRRVEKSRGLEVWEHADSALPTAILIHDSFGDALIPLLAQSFSRLVATRDAWPVELFEQGYDAVVLLRAEHLLVAQPPDLNPLLDPEQLALRFEQGAPVWHLDPERAERELLPEGRLELRLESRQGAGDPPAAVLLEHVDGFDSFQLPAVDWPVGTLPALRAVLDCEQPAALDVFYQTTDEPRFDVRRGFRKPLVAGRNELVLVLSVGDVAGPLRVRTSTQPGTTVLRELELRALRD